MQGNSIYWYDFETFGVDPRRDRASQFAGVRTDTDLNLIGEPLVQYCQPADDFLPSPMACLITGITPQQARDEGLVEAEFVGRIEAEFSEPGSCVAGYNSIRFDDEVTRQLLYRNFFDPYEREWKNGNSRWDILDMLRLCATLRPEGIEWPRRGDGQISFRLEKLSVANGIEHSQAHDALSDVLATIGMAKLVKTKQPKLYDYVFALRDKRRVQREIDLASRKPVLHISGMYPASRGNMALVMPLGRHPTNSNGILVYDLRQDPAEWLGLSPTEIRERLFAPQEQLPEGVERIGLKVLHLNRCPVVVSTSVLPEGHASRYGIDLTSSRAHWQRLAAEPGLEQRLQEVFKAEPAQAESDPDYMIYSGGFFSDQDRGLMQTIRATPPSDLGRLDLPFRDARLQEMLFRYRARNHPETLSPDEQARWGEFRQARLADADAQARYKGELAQAREQATPEQEPLLDALEDYVRELSRLPMTAPRR